MPHSYFAHLGKKTIALNAHCAINPKGELLLYGKVGDWWEGLDAKTIVQEVERLDSDTIVVRINSDGGSIMEGLAMYHALKASGKPVITIIDGIAASMAGAIFLAGSERHIPVNGFFHLHKANLAGVSGNAIDLRGAADQLESIERSYVQILAENSGQSTDDIYAIIADGDEHFYLGQEAIDAGFATQLYEYPIQAAAQLKATGQLGQKLHTLITKQQLFPAAAAAHSTPQEPTMLIFKITAKTKTPYTAAQAILIAATLTENHQADTLKDAAAALGVPGVTENMLAGTEAIDDNVLAAMAKKLGVAAEEEEPEPAAVMPQAQAGRLAAIAAQAGLGAEQVATWIANNTSIEDASFEAVMAVAKQRESTMPAGGGLRTTAGGDIKTALAQAMLVRANPGVHQHTEASAEFAYCSLMDAAKAYLQSKGERVGGLRPNDVMAMAFSSASDFPLLLADVANKELLGAYKKKSRSFTTIARRASATDFKSRHIITMGSGSGLEKVGENGEYKTGKFSEAENSYALESYGRIFRFGRKHMINDDLNSLVLFMQNVGAKAASLEQKVFWTMFLSELKFNGEALYSQKAGTLVNAGASIAGALTKMKGAIRKQKDLDGEALDLQPAILITSTDREEEALKELAAVAATKAADVNIHSNSLSLLAESRLDGIANDPFYILAPMDEAPVFEYCYLLGEENPRVDTQYGFEVDGMSLKIAHDFAAGCIGGRGVVKNSGAN